MSYSASGEPNNPNSRIRLSTQSQSNASEKPETKNVTAKGDSKSRNDRTVDRGTVERWKGGMTERRKKPETLKTESRNGGKYPEVLKDEMTEYHLNFCKAEL